MDWSKVISELEDSGLTQTEIAEGAGCSQPYISQLKTGARKKCDYATGDALVKLRAKRGGKERVTAQGARS